MMSLPIGRLVGIVLLLGIGAGGAVCVWVLGWPAAFPILVSSIDIRAYCLVGWPLLLCWAYWSAL